MSKKHHFFKLPENTEFDGRLSKLPEGAMVHIKGLEYEIKSHAGLGANVLPINPKGVVAYLQYRPYSSMQIIEAQAEEK